MQRNLVEHDREAGRCDLHDLLRECARQDTAPAATLEGERGRHAWWFLAIGAYAVVG